MALLPRICLCKQQYHILSDRADGKVPEAPFAAYENKKNMAEVTSVYYYGESEDCYATLSVGEREEDNLFIAYVLERHCGSSVCSLYGLFYREYS